MIVAVGVGCKFAAGGEELYLGVVGGECGSVDCVEELVACVLWPLTGVSGVVVVVVVVVLVVALVVTLVVLDGDD